MHLSSLAAMRRFIEKHLAHRQEENLSILDLGARDIGGAYRSLFDKPGWRYVGADTEPGENVDLVLAHPYRWEEIEAHSFDVLVSGQTFEHIEFFWLTMEQIARTLVPGGLMCVIAPSSGYEHRYPLDCWRFYPDGMRASAQWAGLIVLEASTQWDSAGYEDFSDAWADTVLVAATPSEELSIWQNRYWRDRAQSWDVPFIPGEISPFSRIGEMVARGEKILLSGPTRPGFAQWLESITGEAVLSGSQDGPTDMVIFTGGQGPNLAGCAANAPRFICWRAGEEFVLNEPCAVAEEKPEGWTVTERVVWRPVNGPDPLPSTAGRFVAQEILAWKRPVSKQADQCHEELAGRRTADIRKFTFSEMQKELNRTYSVVDKYQDQINRMAEEAKRSSEAFKYVESLALKRREHMREMAQRIEKLKNEKKS